MLELEVIIVVLGSQSLRLTSSQKGKGFARFDHISPTKSIIGRRDL